MIDIKSLENGFLIENKFYFTWEHTLHQYINLRKLVWPEMNYGIKSNFIIDYPWEYDIQDIFFNVYAGDENKLNYFIKFEDKKIAIIQNPKAVEKDFFENVEYCIYTEDFTQNVLDKMEYEGEAINLNQLDLQNDDASEDEVEINNEIENEQDN